MIQIRVPPTEQGCPAISISYGHSSTLTHRMAQSVGLVGESVRPKDEDHGSIDDSDQRIYKKTTSRSGDRQLLWIIDRKGSLDTRNYLEY
ncbi:hypothetical protein BDW42DRAFT_163470 [Aspergillus taichungensis]|uniref:Uncharacterized protein n=1 Tax=Aspergillus taichungensis TaxID=482145 RepID=A0A2J5I2F2_9EURO|nr:hypothetical protein BDW42DRAFT_163470 [Aspergillus taichungensis]